MGQKILQVALLLIVSALTFAEPDFQDYRRLERYQQQPLFIGGLRNFLFGPFPIRQPTYNGYQDNNDNKPSYFPRKPKQQVIEKYHLKAFCHNTNTH